MNKHFQKLVDRYPDLEFILYTENDLLDGLDLIEFGKEYKEIEEKYRNIGAMNEEARAETSKAYKDAMDVVSCITAECEKNIWFFIREILQIPKNLPSDDTKTIVDMDRREEGDMSFEIHPWEVAYIWAYINKYPIYINGFKGMNRSAVQVALILYERVIQHKSMYLIKPSVYDIAGDPSIPLLFNQSHWMIIKETVEKFPFMKSYLYTLAIDNRYGYSSIYESTVAFDHSFDYSDERISDICINGIEPFTRKQTYFPYGLGRVEIGTNKFSKLMFSCVKESDIPYLSMMQFNDIIIDQKDPNILYSLYGALKSNKDGTIFIGFVNQNTFYDVYFQENDDRKKTDIFTEVDLSKLSQWNSIGIQFLAFVYNATPETESIEDSDKENIHEMVLDYENVLGAEFFRSCNPFD